MWNLIFVVVWLKYNMHHHHFYVVVLNTKTAASAVASKNYSQTRSIRIKSKMMYLIPIHLFEFIEKKLKRMAFKLLWNNHILKNGNLWCNRRKKIAIAIYTVSLSLSMRMCFCFVQEIRAHCIHSKNILNTDLLRAKIKMSWERNKSSAKRWLFVRMLISWEKFLTSASPTQSAVIYPFIHSFIHSRVHNGFLKSLPFSLNIYK